MSTPSLALSTRHRSELALAARNAHPEECCGVLLGRLGAAGEKLVEQVVATPNVSMADRRRSFEIDPAMILEARNQARAHGWTLVGFYHSHPDGGDAPSSRDQRDAWPGMSYVIVPRDAAIASWRQEEGGVLVAEVLVERGTHDAHSGRANALRSVTPGQ